MEKMVFQRALLSGGLTKAIAVLYAADKVCSFWSICALSRFRLSPKSLETSHHGGKGLLSPFYPNFSSFVISFP